jgi:hypothetical protein
MSDHNIQDLFVVKVGQDPEYGTPTITTLGGRSSCPGETGTTKRDSRVEILKVEPRCGSEYDACEALPLGQDAIYSVIVQNLSPWKASVKYLLRAVNGGSTSWDAGKENRAEADDWDAVCPPGDMGSLEIRPLSSTKADLRDGNGLVIVPLPYGQVEVRIRVSRPAISSPQCLTFNDIELELVSLCEDTDWDSVQDVYQYKTTKMDPESGEFNIAHPVWDNDLMSFEDETKALGPARSKAKFSVSWSDAVRGCKYETATNYNPAATVDDRSCTFTEDVEGCIYEGASNFNPAATVDDDSCSFSASLTAHAETSSYGKVEPSTGSVESLAGSGLDGSALRLSVALGLGALCGGVVASVVLHLRAPRPEGQLGAIAVDP